MKTNQIHGEKTPLVVIAVADCRACGRFVSIGLRKRTIPFAAA
ncbi:MAG TPA: hypothetical protein VGH19_01120 [Verrucomicrobiae bacterium]